MGQFNVTTEPTVILQIIRMVPNFLKIFWDPHPLTHTYLSKKSPIYIPCCQLYNIYASLPGGLEDSQAMLYLMVTYLLNPLSFIPSLLSPYCSSVNLFGYRYCHFRLLLLLVPSFHYSLSFHISHLGNCIIMVYLTFANSARVPPTGWNNIAENFAASPC